MKLFILFFLFSAFSYGKTTKLTNLKFPMSIHEFKNKVKLSDKKSIPTANNLELIVDRNFAFISDKKSILHWFEYKTEFNPETTTFIFLNQSNIFSKNYQKPKKVFLKIGLITNENAVDKFLLSSFFTIFNKMHIEVVTNLELAEEVITIDASVNKMPANFMRRIYLQSVDKKQNKLWDVEIKSPGKLDGIRRMIPSMALSSEKFIMKNEKEVRLEISGVKVRDFFYETVAMNLGTKNSIINY